MREFLTLAGRIIRRIIEPFWHPTVLAVIIGWILNRW